MKLQLHRFFVWHSGRPEGSAKKRAVFLADEGELDGLAKKRAVFLAAEGI